MQNTVWTNPDYHWDTTCVSEIVNITINNAVYSDVYLLERYAFCCNDYLIESIWFKPYVGLIRLNRKHLILGPYKDETWQLINYTVKYY